MLPTQVLTDWSEHEGQVHAEGLACINPSSMIEAPLPVAAVALLFTRSQEDNPDIVRCISRGHPLVSEKAGCILRDKCAVSCMFYPADGDRIEDTELTMPRERPRFAIPVLAASCLPVRRQGAPSAAVYTTTGLISDGPFEDMMAEAALVGNSTDLPMPRLENFSPARTVALMQGPFR